MGMEMSFPANYHRQLLGTLESIDLERVNQAIDWLTEAREAGSTVFVAGNGGSAATAAHFVCDMVKGASYGKQTRFRIVALGQNLPTMTAYSNDVHYSDALLEEFKNFARPGDLYMCISGSGNSPNVVRTPWNTRMSWGARPSRSPAATAESWEPWRSWESTFRSRTWAGSKTPIILFAT